VLKVYNNNNHKKVAFYKYTATNCISIHFARGNSAYKESLSVIESRREIGVRRAECSVIPTERRTERRCPYQTEPGKHLIAFSKVLARKNKNSRYIRYKHCYISIMSVLKKSRNIVETNLNVKLYKMKRLLTSAFVAVIAMTACNNKQGSASADDASKNAKAKTFVYNGNPLIRDNFTADPAPVVVGDKLYLFVGHDEYYEGQDTANGGKEFNNTEWLCYSTEDMKTWTDHGSVLRPSHFAWADTVIAKVGTAWASQVVPYNDKYYYFTTCQGQAPYTGYCVGVAVADKPEGPYRDAIGKPLICDTMTVNGPRGWWNDIDPTVLIDNGEAWLSWGNGTCFLAKLNDDLTSLADSIRTMRMPKYIEGPWLHKYNNKYYLSYASMGMGGEAIDYAMADSMTGEWEHKGQITGSAENSFTIHPGIVEFKGTWYLFYHNATVTIDGHKGTIGRRSVCFDVMEYNEDGTIKFVEQTKEAQAETEAPQDDSEN
jgi:hypothetical protein